MKYVIETDEPLSEMMIDFIMKVKGNTFIKNIKPLDHEFSKVVDEHFWELV